MGEGRSVRCSMELPHGVWEPWCVRRELATSRRFVANSSDRRFSSRPYECIHCDDCAIPSRLANRRAKPTSVKAAGDSTLEPQLQLSTQVSRLAHHSGLTRLLPLTLSNRVAKVLVARPVLRRSTIRMEAELCFPNATLDTSQNMTRRGILDGSYGE